MRVWGVGSGGGKQRRRMGAAPHGRTPARAPASPLVRARVCVGPPQAARLTLVQILMASKGLQMNPLQSLYYVSPACLLCLLVPFGARARGSLRGSP